MKYYEKTKYPAIYKNVYWGWFDTAKEKYSEEIINNRNQFIERNNIKGTCHFKSLSERSNWFQCELDHKEMYRGRDDRIFLLYSNYDRDRAGITTAKPFKGFRGHADLYHAATTTYIKIFRDFKELKQFWPKLNKMVDERVCQKRRCA
jgi:hypothetical protein